MIFNSLKKGFETVFLDDWSQLGVDALSKALEDQNLKSSINAMMTKKVSDADIVATLSKKGYAEETIKSELAIQKESAAKEANIKSTNRQVVANKTLSLTLSSLKTVASAVGTAIVSILATKAIMAAYEAWDKYANRVQYAQEALENSIDSYNEVSQELNDLRTESEEVNKQLKELEESKGIQNLVNDEEYQKLKDTNAELNKNIELEEARQKIAARNAWNDAKTVYNTLSDENRNDLEYNPDAISVWSGMNTSGFSDNIIEENKNNINFLLGALDALDKRSEEVNNSIENLMIAQSTASDEEYQNIQSEIEVLENQKTSIDSSISSIMSNLENYRSILENTRDTFRYNKDSGNFITSKDEEIFNNTLIILNAITDAILNVSDASSDMNDELNKTEQKSDIEVKVRFKDKEEAISAINQLSEGFDSLDKLYKDVKDKGAFDYTLIDDNIFKETFSGLGDSYTNFIEQISNSPSDIDACQEAFNNLVTEWINSTGILDRVTEETAGLTEAMLTNMGVANAADVVSSALEVQAAQAEATAIEQLYLADTGNVLTDQTWEVISAFANEQNASDLTISALAQLKLAQLDVTNNPINVDTSISSILSLAKAAQISAKYIKRLQLMDNLQKEIQAGTASKGDKYFFDRLAETLNEDPSWMQSEIEFEPVQYTGGNRTSSYSGKSNKKEEEPKEPQVFDWMPEQIENLNEEIEKLEANMESVAGFKLKNKYVDDIISDLEKEIELYDQMTAKYQERLDSIGLAQEYIDKIQNGTMQIEDIADTEGNQALIQQIEDYQKWYDEIENCNSSVIEIKQRIEELRFQKLDNIIDEFDTLESSISDCVNTQEELMSLMEQTGEEISFEDYEKLTERQTELAKLNAQYYDELKEEMDRLNIQEGSEEWEKYNSQLEEFKQNIISCGQAVEDYKDEIFELTFKELDDFNSKLDEINNTISTMRDLIGDAGLVTEEGLTDRGLVQVALYAQELANAQKQSAEYVEAMEALDEALDSGLITQEEYNEAISEYRSGQESAVQAAKQAQAAIIQIVKDGIQAQIDAKTEEINATKEQLDAEKELNDYRESITDKSNQIAVLQKQIATLSLSTDRRDLAQRLELQEKLADLQKEMYNEQADHALEEQQDALDEELENYTEAKESEMEELDTNLDKQTEAINEYLEQVKTNYNTVYAILNEYGDAYSLSAIEDLTAPWDSGKDAADLCSEAIGNVCAEINYEIENIDASPIYDLINAFKELIDLEYGAFDGFGTGGVSNRYEDVTDQGKWQKNDTGWWYGNSDDDYVANGIYTINGKQYGFNKDGYMKTGWHEIDGTWYYFEPENGQMVKSTWRKSKDGGDYYLTADGTMATNAAVKDKDDDNTYYYVDGSGRWDGFELSKDQVEELKYDIAYRKGTKNARPGIALTDEEGLGSEVVITKYGALRQLDSGDSVFNAEQVKNLHALSAVNGLPDKIASLARNLTKNVMYNNNGLNITSPLIQIDGTGLSSAEVASLISAQVDDLPTRIMRAIKYNLR